MIDRRAFLELCAALGVSVPALGVLSGCADTAGTAGDSGGISNVIIVGAGAGGLTAGYLLQQRGIPFQILEASAFHGGRMKELRGFVDFPVPLGAEWIHVDVGILSEIVNDSTVRIDVETVQYDHAVDVAHYNGLEVPLSAIGFTDDSKFVNTTWFDFYERFIVPSVSPHIVYNAVVTDIDYRTDTVTVKTHDQTFVGDRAVVSIPVKMLQNGSITFTPALPSAKQSAIDAVRVWDGCKAFIEFSEPFYPAVTAIDIVPETAGQKLYYDAAYGQRSGEHVLGLFAVGSACAPFIGQSDAARISYMLAELDDLFDGAASRHYRRHVFQNWNDEPFIEGAYVMDHEDWQRVRALGRSVNGRVFFAGTAYTEGDDWGSVHTAARSAMRAISELTQA
ncbi:MAG: FAD-dependent oxidoreductase [Pseudomonadota bacterium]